MKVRNCASVPTLISPAITFSPPNHSTRPMAAKNEKFMALVLLTRMSTRCMARSSASCLARSNFSISCRCAAKARTTRMPPRFSSMTRLSTDSRSCSVSQVLLQRQLGDRGSPGDERHEAQAEQPEHEIGADQQIGADADQHAEQHHAHEAGRKEHAHAVEIEQPERDEVAGVDLVVEGKAQPLDLLVERQAQLVAGLMADGLAVVVLDHGEEAAQDADDQQRQRRRPQRVLGGRTRARGHHALRLVDGPPEQARDEQLQRRRDEGRDDGDRHLPGMAQRHAGDAQQRAEALAPGCFRDMGKRLAALLARCWLHPCSRKISKQFRGLAQTNEAELSSAVDLAR